MKSSNTKHLLPVALLAVAAYAIGNGNLFGLGDEPGTVTLEHINPNATFGLSDAVAVHAPGARFIFLSGQVGFSPTGVPEDLGEQADVAFGNVIKQLKDAGAGPEDVVKINTYIKDLDLAKAQVVGAAKNKYFTADKQPASTWVGVTGLVLPNLLVEVEAIAVVSE